MFVDAVFGQCLRACGGYVLMVWIWVLLLDVGVGLLAGGWA